jgi:hypothetical protein
MTAAGIEPSIHLQVGLTRAATDKSMFHEVAEKSVSLAFIAPV